MLSGIEKTVIAKKPFTASLDGINIKSYAEGDLITGPIEVINDIIANGWASIPKEKAKDQEEDTKMVIQPENTKEEDEPEIERKKPVADKKKK